ACSTRRAHWCSRCGPTRSISRNGGGRTASPPRRMGMIFVLAAYGVSSCTGLTAATIRTALHSTRLNPADLAWQVPVRRRACARHQTLRRGQGPRTDDGAARRLSCHDADRKECVDDLPFTTAHATQREDRSDGRQRPTDRSRRGFLATAETPWREAIARLP